MSDTGSSGSDRTDSCDFCYRNFPVEDLEWVYTILNGIEQKERVCPNCEDEAREYEKPVATDGGTSDRYQTCQECDGEGTVQTLGPVRDDFEGDVPDYEDLTVADVECRRCEGDGEEHAEGCPRCGEELHDHGVMPSSAREIGCHDCGFTELVG